MEYSFALLSGGNSRRFNDDKTKALLNGTPLYKYGLECGLLVSDDVIHISKNKEKYKPFIKGVKYIEDEYNEVCPMSGLLTAAKYAQYENIFILSADSPLITFDFFKFLYSNLESFQGVIPVVNNKHYPLIAIYKRNVLQSMEKDYNNKNYKLIKSLENHNILYIQEEKILKAGFSREIFVNINYKEDLKVLEEKNG